MDDLTILVKVAALLFVVSSMLAMGLSLTVPVNPCETVCWVN